MVRWSIGGRRGPQRPTISSPSPAAAITASGLKADGTVTAWGWNNLNQLAVPAGLSNVVAIACGSGHSIALKADGTVTGWGFNSYGQADYRWFYTNAVDVAASGDFSMALLANGSVQSWGGGMDLVPGDLWDVVQAAAGAHHCVAVKSDGTVQPWGNLTRGLAPHQFRRRLCCLCR